MNIRNELWETLSSFDRKEISQFEAMQAIESILYNSALLPTDEVFINDMARMYADYHWGLETEENMEQWNDEKDYFEEGYHYILQEIGLNEEE